MISANKVSNEDDDRTCGIEEAQSKWLIPYHDSDSIIVEDLTTNQYSRKSHNGATWG